MSTKQERLELANKLIKEISKNGRNFFAHKDRVSFLEMDYRGRIWFCDSYSDRKIYTHYNGEWSGFTQGGTLKNLVKGLVQFIQTGEPRFTLQHLGYTPKEYCGWGYSTSELRPIWEVGKPLLNANGLQHLEEIIQGVA